MRRNRNRRLGLIATIIAYLATASAFAAATLVSATIEPAQITVGESAQLTITSLGTGMEPISLPVVPGLEFRIVDRSRRNEIIRGAALATTTMVVRVTPQVAGTFTIPGDHADISAPGAARKSQQRHRPLRQSARFGRWNGRQRYSHVGGRLRLHSLDRA